MTWCSLPIRWSFDGFPIYGANGANGVEIMNCGSEDAHDTYCQDECGGYEGELPGVDDYTYRYYFTGKVSDLDSLPRTPGAGTRKKGGFDVCVTVESLRDQNGVGRTVSLSGRRQDLGRRGGETTCACPTMKRETSGTQGATQGLSLSLPAHAQVGPEAGLG